MSFLILGGADFSAENLGKVNLKEIASVSIVGGADSFSGYGQANPDNPFKVQVTYTDGTIEAAGDSTISILSGGQYATILKGIITVLSTAVTAQSVILQASFQGYTVNRTISVKYEVQLETEAKNIIGKLSSVSEENKIRLGSFVKTLKDNGLLSKISNLFLPVISGTVADAMKDVIGGKDIIDTSSALELYNGYLQMKKEGLTYPCPCAFIPRFADKNYGNTYACYQKHPNSEALYGGILLSSNGYTFRIYNATMDILGINHSVNGYWIGTIMTPLKGASIITHNGTKDQLDISHVNAYFSGNTREVQSPTKEMAFVPTDSMANNNNQRITLFTGSNYQYNNQPETIDSGIALILLCNVGLQASETEILGKAIEELCG